MITHFKCMLYVVFVKPVLASFTLATKVNRMYKESYGSEFLGASSFDSTHRKTTNRNVACCMSRPFGSDRCDASHCTISVLRICETCFDCTTQDYQYIADY